MGAPVFKSYTAEFLSRSDSCLARSRIVKAFARLRQSLQQRRRFPVVSEAGAILPDLRQHGLSPHRIGEHHWPAAVAGKAESVHPNYIDVAGPQGHAFLEHICAFVSYRNHDARDDLVVGDRMTRDPTR